MSDLPTPLREEAEPAPLKPGEVKSTPLSADWERSCRLALKKATHFEAKYGEAQAEADELRRALSLEKQRAAGREAAFAEAQDMAWTSWENAWKHIQKAFRQPPDELD